MEVVTTLVMEMEPQAITPAMVIMETLAITQVMEIMEILVITLAMEVETLAQALTLAIPLEIQAITLDMEMEIPDTIPDITALHLFQETAIATTSVVADPSAEATEEVMEVAMEVAMVEDMDADQADLCAELGAMLLLSALVISGNTMVVTVTPVLVLAGDMVTTLVTHKHSHSTHHIHSLDTLVAAA